MPMNHSKKPDDWLRTVVEANPIRIGKNGNIITCPSRLHFADIFVPQKGLSDDDNQDKAPKYGCSILFPPGCIQGIESVIKPKLVERAKMAFPEKVDDEGNPTGVHFSIHRQDDKLEQQGYTRGLLYTNVSTRFQPQVYDTAYNSITDPSKVYNGVWAILELNVYHYSVKGKKGVGLGLQSVMVFADDTKLVSAKRDPRKVFEGVKIDAAYNPDDAFGSGPAKRERAPADSIMPDATSVQRGAETGSFW